jgi:DTW domain-containing protein YfiP
MRKGSYSSIVIAILLLAFLNLESIVLYVEALSSTNGPPTINSKDYASHLKTKIASSEAKCERRQRERQVVARALCPRCHRPPILCVCDAIPKEKVSTSTNILVLQHRNEHKRTSLSTVPLMPMVLSNCIVKVGYNFLPESLELVQKYLDRGKKPLLLFPGPDAVSLDVEDERNNLLQSMGNTNDDSVDTNVNDGEGELLILIDGTWNEARRMLKQSPVLVDACQQVQFTCEYESIYGQLREEPEKHCISTLEACAESLTLLEPDENVATKAKQSLHKAMKHMVDIKQKLYHMNHPSPRFVRPGMREAKKAERSKEVERDIFGE